eukprot:gb/GEZN01011557.1/.p1 GENE.gb/GEZN01011557.1/~~gb/GEZN01011557.1/.p1  ORF type:complete len:204 (+),score=30.84 gb/GEZN01011557.1/:134-745(+)
MDFAAELQIDIDKRTRGMDYWMKVTTSKACIALYIFLGAANIAILALELSGNGRHIAVVVFETFINLILFGEVFVNIIIYKKAFFHDWVNVLDLVITILCFALFIVFLVTEGVREDFDQISEEDEVLLVFRYLLLVLRFAVIVRNARVRTKILTQGNVEFNSHQAVSLAELRSQSGHQHSDGSEQEGAPTDPQFLDEMDDESA